jgi:hypothetical protein
MELPKKFDPIELVAGLASVGAGFYWKWSYSGPYRWLAELQLGLLGQYEVMLTLLLAMAVPAVPLTVAVRWARGRIFRTDGDLGEDSAVLRALRWAMPRLGPLAFLAVAGWFAWLGATMMRDADAPVAQVDLAAIERGAPWPDGRVAIRGVLLSDAEVEFGESYHPERYVPLVSTVWTPSDVVVAFLVDAPEFASRRWPIVARLAGRVPGPVRVALEKSGARVSPSAVALTPHLGDAAELKAAGERNTMVAAGALVVAAIWLAVLEWRARRRSRAGLVRG